MKLKPILMFFFSFYLLDLCSQTYHFKSYGKGIYNSTFVSSNYKDTIIIVDTLKHTVIKNRINEIRSANFINEYGLILARISDGEGLVNSKGKMLNGPCGIRTTEYLRNGYILTGYKWGDYSDPTYLGKIIFNAKGDTILCDKRIYSFHNGYTDTTLVEGFNPKTKRQEKGYLLKSGKWQTKEYVDRTGVWFAIKQKVIKTKK